MVPITPKLMALLRERFETMPEGETPLVTIGGKGAVIRRVRRIWAKASVEPWARLWQTLRSSCEKEWAMTFPQFAVSRWIGHSITISGKHYANAVPDELFERAAKTPAACAQRQAQWKASDGAGNEKKQRNGAEGTEAQNSANFRDLRRISASPGVSEEWSRGESNPRALSESPGEYADSDRRAAPGAALAAPGAKRSAGRGPARNCPPDADLARLVAAWTNLPPDVRAGIVAALGAATTAR